MIGLSHALAAAQAQTVASLCAPGHLQLYAGVRPPTPDDLPAEAAWLAEWDIANAEVVERSAVFSLADPVAYAVARGRATWFRVRGEGGAWDGDVGLLFGDAALTQLDVERGAKLLVLELIYTVPQR